MKYKHIIPSDIDEFEKHNTVISITPLKRLIVDHHGSREVITSLAVVYTKPCTRCQGKLDDYGTTCSKCRKEME